MGLKGKANRKNLKAQDSKLEKTENMNNSIYKCFSSLNAALIYYEILTKRCCYIVISLIRGE